MGRERNLRSLAFIGIYCFFFFFFLLGREVEAAPLRGSKSRVEDWHQHRRQAMENRETPAPTKAETSEPTTPPTLSPTEEPTEEPTETPETPESPSPTLSPVESPAPVANPTNPPEGKDPKDTPAPVETTPSPIAPAPENPPVESPTNPPVQTPTDQPVQSPVDSPVESVPSSKPVNQGSNPSSEESPLPPNTRQLASFSLTIEGELADESAFRRDLELYLFHSMKPKISVLDSISLEPTPAQQPQRRSRQRSLQQATLLQYEGTATLTDDIFGSPTDGDIQASQAETLEDGPALQAFISDSSTQPLNILNVQVSGRDSVAVSDPQGSGGSENDNTSGQTGLIVGVAVAVFFILVAVICLGFYLRSKPPPPPPYELEVISDVGSDADNEGGLRKSLGEGTKQKDRGAPDEEMEQARAVMPRKRSLYSDPIEVLVPETPIVEDDSSDAAESGVEIINLTEDGNLVSYQDTTDRKKKSLAKEEEKEQTIDLTIAAKNPEGIEAIVKDVQEMEIRLEKVKGMERTRSNELANNYMPRTRSTASHVSTGQSVVTHDSHYAMTIGTFASYDEESMAGFSLATDGQKSLEPTTPRRQPEETPEVAMSPDESPMLKNNPQMKWFEQPRLGQKKVQSEYISSDSESNITLEEVSNPLRNSITGVEVTQDLFLDENDDDDINHGSGDLESEVYSSYKEDDSVKGGSSVMSGILSEDSEQVYTNHEKNIHGALGYFHREEDNLDDYDVLPQVSPPKHVDITHDNLSDAPSDERHNNDMTPKHKHHGYDEDEQDLSGFDTADAIMEGLEQFTPERFKPPVTKSATKNSTSASSYYSGNPPNVTPDGSWEEDPEMVQQYRKERRRMKRAARKQRAERKQPPVTMEI